MKHLLRAMGAAMLAALLLSACSTPQEQTEPSAPQTTQGHAGRNRRDGGVRNGGRGTACACRVTLAAA